jgi:hypothetical protein
MTEATTRPLTAGHDLFGLVVGILGVWRITHLLAAEDGPWNLVARLRRRAGTGAWGELLDCFLCLSVWVAWPVAALLGRGPARKLGLWPALSAGAILLEQATNRGADDRTNLVVNESEEHQHGVLWGESGASQQRS